MRRQQNNGVAYLFTSCCMGTTFHGRYFSAAIHPFIRSSLACLLACFPSWRAVCAITTQLCPIANEIVTQEHSRNGLWLQLNYGIALCLPQKQIILHGQYKRQEDNCRMGDGSFVKLLNRKWAHSNRCKYDKKKHITRTGKCAGERRQKIATNESKKEKKTARL